MQIVFVVDLNLPVPAFISSLAEKFKPGQLEEFVERLDKAAVEVNVA